MESNIPETWEPEEINRALRSLPAEIAKASQEAVETEGIVKDYKHTIAMLEAAERVAQINEKAKLNASDITAIVRVNNPAIYEEYMEAEKVYSMKKVRFEYLRDLFDSCRKAASLRIEEARRLEGTMSRRTNP